MKSKLILGLAALLVLAMPMLAQGQSYTGGAQVVNAGYWVGGVYYPYYPDNNCYYDAYGNLQCPNYYSTPYVGYYGGYWGHDWDHDRGYYGRGFEGRGGYGYARGGYGGGYARGGEHAYSGGRGGYSGGHVAMGGGARGFSGGGRSFGGGGHSFGGGHGGRGR